jgi:hypothetical protein
MASFLSEDEINKSFKLNNEGYKRLKDGRVLDGLSTIENACELGLPHALASLTWTKMLLNDPEGAIEGYKKYTHQLVNWYASVVNLIGQENTDYQFKEQLFNVRTNYATALYLTGADVEAVLEACAEAEQHRWAEAEALSYVVRGESLNQSFTRKNLLDLIETSKNIQSDFNFYCESVPELVKDTQHKAFHKYAQELQSELEKIPVYQLEDEMDFDFQYGDRMPIGKMAEIFVEFLEECTDDAYAPFYQKHGLTLRLGLALVNDMVKIAPDGFDAFENAWFDMCDEFGEDPEALYDSLEDLQDGTSND